MKKVIERLEEALALIWNPPTLEIEKKFLNVSVSNIIKEVLEDLKTHRWETPEQYEQRTREKWPDDWPVWSITTDGILEITTMGEEEIRKTWGNHIYVIATEAGPPPDGWRPEENE
jgi:hypothetical protein